MTLAAKQMLLSEAHQKVESLENRLMLPSEVKIHAQKKKKNGSGEDVKEVGFYEVSGFKTITMLIFLTFLSM